MNTSKENFEYFGFAEEVIPETLEGDARIYNGIAADRENRKRTVDVTIFNDDSFDMVIDNPNGEILLNLVGAPLRCMEDILKLVDVVGLKMVHEEHPSQYHKWRYENAKTYNNI
jgi:hypothetical protein